MVGREKELSIHFVPGCCQLVEVMFRAWSRGGAFEFVYLSLPERAALPPLQPGSAEAEAPGASRRLPRAGSRFSSHLCFVLPDL